MNNIELPPSFVKLILEFSDIFTRPSFKHFTRVVSGMLLVKSKKRITSIAIIHGLIEKFYNLHRFFNQYKWDYQQLGLRALGVIITVLRLKELTLVVDDTFVMKYGKCIFGRALHHNHARKPNVPNYIYGHNWVTMGVIAYLGVFQKWICFPFLSQLYIPHKYCSNPSLFRSKIAMTVEMLAAIKERITLALTVVADGFFAKEGLVRFCLARSITFIGRLRSDVALYRQVPQLRKRSRGRPRKYGSKIAMKKLVCDDHKFETMKLRLYGKKRRIKVQTFNAYWKPAGAIIKVLIVKFPHDKKEIINYYFTTDLTLSVKKTISLIGARWSIETTFKDLKEHVGLNNWQVRKELSVTRSATISCITHTLVTLWTYQELAKHQLDLWDALPWYTQKKTISTANMVQFFKNKCISININSLLSDISNNQQKISEILAFMRLAA